MRVKFASDPTLQVFSTQYSYFPSHTKTKTMGAEISTPEGEDFMTKSFHEMATLASYNEDEEEIVQTLRKIGRSSSPLIGKEVITSNEMTEGQGLGPKSLDQSDGKVQVNIAMADLMAYLQVVANHSSNLPQTRRDDPAKKDCAMDTPDDVYANKAAAFIPSDVRIIAGRFMLYGKTWNLPDHSEFAPAERTLEPGKLLYFLKVSFCFCLTAN